MADYHDNLTTLAKRLKPLMLQTAITAAVTNAEITLNAGAGLTGGGTGNTLSIALDTPGSLTAASTNSATSPHTHAVTASSDVSTPAAALLKSDASGGLTLNNLLVTGGDLTVGSNIMLVDYSGERVGINCAPDAQFDLDIAGNLRAQGWIVGKHAIQLEGALMICHYDGNVKDGDTTLEPNGHMGQVATVTGDVIGYQPGKFGKAAQFANQLTLVGSNMGFEAGALTSWSNANGGTWGVTTGQRFGNYCMYGTTSSTSQAEFQDISGLSVGGTVIVSAYMKVDSGAAYFYVSDGGGFSNQVTSDAVSTNTWTRKTVSKVVPAGGSIRIVLLTSSTGTVYFDKVQVDTTGYLTPPRINSGAASYLTYPVNGNIMKKRGTIMMWLANPTASGTNVNTSPGIFKWWDNFNTNSVYMEYSTDKDTITAYIYSGSSQQCALAATINWSAEEWHHLAFAWDINTGAALYVDGALEDSDASVSTPNITATTFEVGRTVSGSETNGWIDDFIILDRMIGADEVRAVYESDAPVFAETSTFHFRGGGQNANVWADEEGLWMRDSGGTAVLGAAGVDSKSWGGLAMDSGDIVLGSNTTGKSAIHWDRSTGKFGFYGGGGGTAQVEIDTSGQVTFGGGKGIMGTAGLGFYDTLSATVTQIFWKDQTTPGVYSTMARVYGDWGGNAADPAAVWMQSIRGTSNPWLYAYTAMGAWDTGASIDLRFELYAGGTANRKHARLGAADYIEFDDGCYLRITERTTTPATPTSGTDAHLYIKGDNLIFQWNDGGTTRYKYLPLAGTVATWTHTTSAP